MEEVKRVMRRHCVFKYAIMREFLAEMLGTLILIVFGCGSVAQYVLSKGILGNNLSVNIGFSMGMTVAMWVSGGVSGGHVNPAVSLAMVLMGKLKLWKFPIYVLAQFVGAFFGAAVVYGVYFEVLMGFTRGILSVTGINATAHIFASYPIENLTTASGFLDQVLGTGILIMSILAILDTKNHGVPKCMQPLAIGVIFMAVSNSLGMNCGFSLNPARDLGPRILTAVAGWGTVVFSAGNYWFWVPVVGPMVGSMVGVGVYFMLIQLHHPEAKPDSNQQVDEEAGEEEDDNSSLKDILTMVTVQLAE